MPWVEAMRLQGFPVDDLQIDVLTHRRGMELAGNAFCGFFVAPVVIAALLSDEAWSSGDPVAVAASESDDKEEEEEEDVEEGEEEEEESMGIEDALFGSQSD